MVAYAGIGSRETPKEILNLMKELAKHLANKGYTLRSGHALGADMAFEEACVSVGGSMEIYLPWAGFNNSTSNLVVKDIEAFNIAKRHHPAWSRLNQGGQKLQARNSHQMLGKDLKSFSQFVICYTPNGTGSGGTGQAIRIAHSNGIPVFDLGNEDIRRDIWIHLEHITTR